jgi:hypothetical protein
MGVCAQRRGAPSKTRVSVRWRGGDARARPPLAPSRAASGMAPEEELRMKRSRLAALTGVALAAGLPAAPAHAYVVTQLDALRLDLTGLGQAGVETGSGIGDGEVAEAYLGVARLQARATYKGFGGVMVQFEFKDAKPAVLDAVVTVTPTSFLTVQAGRFKTPVSLEFGLPAANLRFHRRAALKKLIPTRAAGLNGTVQHKLGDVTLGLDVGAFLPPDVDLASGVEHGVLLTGRAFARLPHGITVQVAAADHLFPGGPMPEDPMQQEAVVDLAASYEEGQWFFLTEAAVSVAQQEGPRPYGYYGMGAYRIPMSVGPDLEPAVAYDQLRTGDQVGHFGTVALNAYWLDRNLMTSLDYRGGKQGDEVSHAGFARLQVGF